MADNKRRDLGFRFQFEVSGEENGQNQGHRHQQSRTEKQQTAL